MSRRKRDPWRCHLRHRPRRKTGSPYGSTRKRTTRCHYSPGSKLGCRVRRPARLHTAVGWDKYDNPNPRALDGCRIAQKGLPEVDRAVFLRQKSLAWISTARKEPNILALLDQA